MDGTTPRIESRANSYNLTKLEEEVLIQYIIDMDKRGFVPKLNGVEDIANYILESWGAKKAKYGIVDSDFYNFDEIGFMMGIICSGIIITNAERNSRSKAIQPGNREWATAIIYGNGEGETIPPFLIVQGQVHLFNWYTETDFPADWAIKPTSNE
ncbi:hypothetical protein sscle_04g036690 [Sclerotinia sclerotiorum 1980 UF-70]|uniref:DDE-1 domain-containing protein n=1 Tax=Sclerotinia sclerotiorum (strain ATCC 18683 / 1980 / Ss-1) TaxID=665079 RepID=A0A1D9Q1Y9_SCLS1|nr:hypothetical protein sscle_04g036690 [Sclerotinia sclerotiorum 1980 UF-70]